MILSLVLAAVTLGTATPAEFAIANAQREVAANPGLPASHTHLAAAYLGRARETGDVSLIENAAGELRRALSLAPSDYETRKVSVRLMLAQHEWPAALRQARDLNRQTPDDVSVYGYIADAEIALGNFADALDQTQWMIRLRAGNPETLIHVGRLRELYGDARGAIEAFEMAFDATPFAESEERAWIRTQQSRVHLEAHDASAAAGAAREALNIFPGYHLALEALAAAEVF